MTGETVDIALSGGAEPDPEAIHVYLFAHRDRDEDDAFLDDFPATIGSPEHLPPRGSVQKALAQLRIGEFRQTLPTPCRIADRIVANTIFKLMIGDDRFDMRALLERRLPRGRLT